MLAELPVKSGLRSYGGLQTIILDITNLDAIMQTVKENDVKVIVNCAAWTNVDGAEDPEKYELVEKLNATAPENLAVAMKEVGGLLVHISTDYVFGGDPYNTPCKENQKGTPTGVYGLTKLHGEQNIQKTGVDYLIFRTAWLYSEFGKNFVKTMMSLTATKSQLKVVFDQVGTPTYAYDLAMAIYEIIENRKYLISMIETSEFKNKTLDVIDQFNRFLDIPHITSNQRKKYIKWVSSLFQTKEFSYKPESYKEEASPNIMRFLEAQDSVYSYFSDQKDDNIKNFQLMLQNETLFYDPHLEGYFEENEIGISSRNDVIKAAQKRFMLEERELLFKRGSLSDSDYEKSMDLAGRTLTQYVTFRQYIIDKLKKVGDGDKEEIIHDLIVPKRQVIKAPNSYLNVYRNNIWIFDDKFMTFDVVLSEKETTALLKQIEPESTIRNIDRPDIAIIFSEDPKTASKVDVVIVELKKKGLKGGENIKVEYQLEQRARALYPLFDKKIQSLWLYGVTQLDEDYKATLDTMGYRPLFSKGTVYVNANPITITTEPERIIVPAVRYVMDIDAVVKDADARNKTFMDLIRERMKKTEEETGI